MDLAEQERLSKRVEDLIEELRHTKKELDELSSKIKQCFLVDTKCIFPMKSIAHSLNVHGLTTTCISSASNLCKEPNF